MRDARSITHDRKAPTSSLFSKGSPRVPKRSVFVGVGPHESAPAPERAEPVHLTSVEFLTLCYRTMGRDRAEAALRDLGWRL